MKLSSKTKDTKSIRVIKAGGDVLHHHFDEFVEIVKSSSAPTIILASPYDDLLNKAWKVLDKPQEIVRFFEEIESIIAVYNSTQPHIKGSRNQLRVNLDKAQSPKRDAKVLSAVSKLSAAETCYRLDERLNRRIVFIPPEKAIQTNHNYLEAEITDVATSEKLMVLISKLSPGDIFVIPAYCGINSFGEPTYLGYQSSEIVAAKIAWLINEISSERTRLNILAPAWYNLHPKWAEQRAQGYLEHVPFLTVEEVLTTADFMLSAIVEATVRGVITEIIDIKTGKSTRIVKNRGNVNEMPIVAVAGYVCVYLEIKKNVYFLNGQTQYGDSAEVSIDNAIGQLTNAEIVLKVSYPTSIVRCLMFKRLVADSLVEEVSFLKSFIDNSFRTTTSICVCTMIRIIGKGIEDHKDSLRRSLKKNLLSKGFALKRYMDDDYYSITLVIDGSEMSGHEGSLEIISKTTLNITNKAGRSKT